MNVKAQEIAQNWLGQLTYSAATCDLDAHMALVSRNVKVLGIPGGKVIDYAGWKKRRHNEFRKKLLRSLSYQLIKVLQYEIKTLRFTVIETMKSTQGQIIIVDKVIKLLREEDGKWRVVQESIDRIELK